MSYLYECSVCHKQTVSAKAAEIENDACCMVCAEEHNHPGKFQAYSSSDPQYFDAERMGKALILYAWSVSGEADEWMGPDGWGTITRFDNYLLNEDSSGFVDFDEYETTEKAEKAYQELYLDGWGQTEWDIFVSCERGRWRAFDGDAGKEIQVWARNGHEYDDDGGIDRDRVLAAISLHMRKTGCFPDIWEVNERGSVTNIGSEVW